MEMYVTYTYNPSLNIYCLFFYFVTMNSFNAEFRNFGFWNFDFRNSRLWNFEFRNSEFWDSNLWILNFVLVNFFLQDL